MQTARSASPIAVCTLGQVSIGSIGSWRCWHQRCKDVPNPQSACGCYQYATLVHGGCVHWTSIKVLLPMAFVRNDVISSTHVSKSRAQQAITHPGSMSSCTASRRADADLIRTRCTASPTPPKACEQANRPQCSNRLQFQSPVHPLSLGSRTSLQNAMTSSEEPTSAASEGRREVTDGVASSPF